mgnify:CR=1 FL=1
MGNLFSLSCPTPKEGDRGRSRDDRTAAADSGFFADHQLAGLVGLLANVLEQLLILVVAEIESAIEWLRVRARDGDSQLILDGNLVGSQERVEGGGGR